MADGILLNVGTGGATLAADDITAVHYQLVKVVFGALDTGTLVTSSVGLPVGDAGGSLTVDNGGTFAVQAAATEADGANVTLGAKADAKSTATDTTAVTIMQVLKQISASVQAPPSQAVTNAGTFAVQAGNLPTTVDTNSGVKSASTLRVVLATDQPALTNKLLVTPDSVALPANQSVNLSQANGVTVLMGNGATGTGSIRVTLANDSTAIAGWGQGATGAAVPSGAVHQGGQAQTALPAAATAGNLTGALMDKFGRQVTLPITIRDLTGTQTTTISASTAETTIVTAAASVFNDLVMLVVSNTSASTQTRIDFRDATAGTVLFSLNSPGNTTVGFAPALAVPQTTVNTNWTAQCSASTTDVRIYAVYAKNR